uniref:Plexin C1 n=1 Tax=Pelusios castaneus TaxID=367368 RepID=A0A8C8SYX6_9SAUR
MGPRRRKDPRGPGPAAPLLLVLAGAGLVACQPRFVLPAPIDNIAASGDSLLVAGGSCLYKLRPSLRGPPSAQQHLAPDCTEPAGARNKLLLPMPGGHLLTGWTLHSGVGEVRFLHNLTVLINSTEVVSCLRDGSTVGALFPRGGNYFLALAATYWLPSVKSDCEPSDSDKYTVITQRRLSNLHVESGESGWLKRPGNNCSLHFVDAFLWGGHLFFPYHPFYPAHRRQAQQPSVAVLDTQGKTFTLVSEMRLDCGNRSTLLSSSLLDLGNTSWWAGVFSAEPAERRWDTTALCLFDMQEMVRRAWLNRSSGSINENHDKERVYYLKSPTLIHSDLSAVYATSVLNKIVLFLGTRYGQLLKVTLNNNKEPNCPEILYEIEEETSVFPKLVLDPEDNNYIYLSSDKEVRRIQVANCNKYGSCKECLSAKDPYCGWCSLSQRYCLIIVTAVGNVSALSTRHFICVMKDAKTNQVLCKNEEPQIMNCSCNVHKTALINRGMFIERSHVKCLFISGYTLSQLKSTFLSQLNSRHSMFFYQIVFCFHQPICNISIEPLWISVLGKERVIIKGENFMGASNIIVVLVFIFLVLNDTHVIFSLPPRHKEAKSVCIKANGGKCSSPTTVYYVSKPSCIKMEPNITWASGGRKITLFGRNFNVTDSVIISDDQRSNVSGCPGKTSQCSFQAPHFRHATENKMFNVFLEVENVSIPCMKLQYHPDPEFIKYHLHTEMDPVLELKLYKKNDLLDISENEIEVYLKAGNMTTITFSVQNITKTQAHSTILCKAKRETDKIDLSTVKVYVKLGDFTREVLKESSNKYFYVLIFIPILLVGVIVVAVIVTRYKSKQLTRKLSQQIELLECEIRKKIRDGFAELQMDRLDVVDSFGTVPFLDYKHFALRTFFPESGGFESIFSEDMHTQRDSSQKNESLSKLHALICNKNFLVTLIHTLEKQKNFSVKDRCLFASFLTIALQTKLVYLTNILEVLTRDLMEQSSNTQPKLMLRRTESVVEKLLTNWLSVCLSGFLRETVGEPFYKLVTALNQRINKGPVDVITCKALYTLNEDWLLWQVTEFKSVALNVFFEEIPENESADTCLNIQVNVLDCDTIEQAKEKIFQAFLNKNGSLYGLQLSETGLELQSVSRYKELLDIDGSTVTLEDGIKKLNTIAVHSLTPFSSCLDVEYSNEYCHLILPDSEDPQRAMHKGKQKFEVKEMYLTKLLSTKVAIHFVVENLFKSIWSLPNNKAPVAIKYFFDFLDAQAESKKITDPDVVHIWKTNSLPLRFWVNILKNPQFVFDIKKTPHIDGCLSVIAQAFMDAFSVTEQQLGKEAPTNKLLYAKDIPLYKEEVKAYYKAIRDLPPLSSSEVEEFLTQESKKHENEFNETVALTGLYKYIEKYYDEILSKVERERGLEDAKKDLLHVKALFDEKKKIKWM